MPILILAISGVIYILSFKNRIVAKFKDKNVTHE
jgi:hypothetical protein